MIRINLIKCWWSIVIVLLPLFSCQNKNESNTDITDNSAEIEVIYFYGKQRCSTCVAMERYAKEAIDSIFPQELKEGIIQFKTIDITTPEGERIADNFEVASSSLFIVDNTKENPERINMTAFGFQNARRNKAEYKQGIIDRINSLMKQ